jgi:hypothetical protein
LIVLVIVESLPLKNGIHSAAYTNDLTLSILKHRAKTNGELIELRPRQDGAAPRRRTPRAA